MHRSIFRPFVWALSFLVPACYGGPILHTSSDTASPPGGGDPGGEDWAAEQAFPGVPGTLATLSLVTRTGPIEVDYLHLENGYGVLEGDIILYGPEDSGMRSHTTPGGLTVGARPQDGGVTTQIGKRWVDRQILWEYHPTLAPPEGGNVRKGFEQAMADIMAAVDVTFVAYDAMVHGANADRIRVQQTGSGCWSRLGREGGVQLLELSPGCAPQGASGIAIHELSHAIGLYHEQSRADRDLHVTVNAGNAIVGYAPQFKAQLTDDVGAYNTASIMHYGSCYFSKCVDPDNPVLTQCWSEDEGVQSYVCGYAERNRAECAHCDCADTDGWCQYPTIVGPGGTEIKAQRSELKPSDIAALEYALGCPDGVDGDYCGEAVGLEAGTLYTCSNGYYDVKDVCDGGACTVRSSPGSNDSCSSGTPDPDAECTTGPCCENGEFSAPGTVCAEDADSEYGCPWGTAAGADVGVRTRDRTCNGSSGACNGVYGEWKPWETADNCAAVEYCDPGDPTCNDSPPTPDCDAGPCCDPDGFFRPAGHTCIDNAESEYDCPWGVGPGDDVGVRDRDQTCSGSSSTCDGAFAPWEGWQTADDCSAEELCEPGQTACQLSCQASTYWDPSSTSDDRWDSLSIQVLTLEKHEVSGAVVRVRVCKPMGTFLNDIHLDYEEWGKHNGLFMYAGTVPSTNQNCSDEIALDTANWSEGENLGAEVRVVSPASCAAMWDDNCTVDPGCGNCWYWLSDTVMTRTCL